MNQTEKTRLDRIEEKIDKMAEAIIALARAEEKIIALDETTRTILKRLVSQDIRLIEVEKELSLVQDTSKTMGNVIKTIFTATIGSIVAAIIWLVTGSSGQ
jgi:tetrahydromethanopterin S-methyltransferase subunit G